MSRVHNLADIATLNIKPIMSPTSFDPIEFIKVNVTHDRAQHQVLSSMAWYIDTTLVATLRSLFFAMFREQQALGHIDSYNEFLAAMSEKEGAEANLVEQGFDHQSNSVFTARKLMLLRQEWHDAALRGASADRRMPSIEELLRNERPMQVNALTRAKLEALALDDANGDKELAAEVLKELILREEMQAMDRHEANKQRIPAMCHMAHFIEATGTATEADFNDLPIDMRKRLLIGMQRALSQATQRLTTDRSVSVIDFLAIRKELKATDEALKATIEHPVFNRTEAVGQEQIDDARVTRDLETAADDKELVQEAARSQRKRKAAGTATV